MTLAIVWNQSVVIRSSGSAIEERKRKTKKTGKRPCTASPEPDRSAAKMPMVPKATVIADREGDQDQAAGRAGGEFGAGDQPDDEVDDRLDDAEHERRRRAGR